MSSPDSIPPDSPPAVTDMALVAAGVITITLIGAVRSDGPIDRRGMRRAHRFFWQPDQNRWSHERGPWNLSDPRQVEDFNATMLDLYQPERLHEHIWPVPVAWLVEQQTPVTLLPREDRGQPEQGNPPAGGPREVGPSPAPPAGKKAAAKKAARKVATPPPVVDPPAPPAPGGGAVSMSEVLSR